MPHVRTGTMRQAGMYCNSFHGSAMLLHSQRLILCISINCSHAMLIFTCARFFTVVWTKESACTYVKAQTLHALPDRQNEFFPQEPHGDDVGKRYQGEHRYVEHNGCIKKEKYPAQRRWVRRPRYRHLEPQVGEEGKFLSVARSLAVLEPSYCSWTRALWSSKTRGRDNTRRAGRVWRMLCC